MKESILIAGLKRGDHDSYKTLFRLYYAKFVNFVNSIIKDPQVAQDLVQEGFIRVWKNRAKLDENLSLENYIYVIVKRLVLNYIRDCKTAESIDNESTAQIRNNPSDSQDLLLIANETRFRIQNIVENMPVQRKKVFIMSRYRHLSNKEIAEELNITVKAVEKHISLALADLRKNIS